MSNFLKMINQPNNNQQTPITILRKLSASKYPVYLGLDPKTKEYVALKAFPSDDPHFKTEKYILQKIIHPHIVALRKTVENVPCAPNEAKSFLGLDYAVHGDVLEIVQDKGGFPEILARSLFHQLINALAFLHSKNIAHLDVKVDNLLIDGNFDLRVTDFDSSQALNSMKLESAGTPGYRAPEVKEGHPEDLSAADVYSAGVVLFVMLSGNFPYNETMKKGKLEYDAYYNAMRTENSKFWEAHAKHKGNPRFYSAELRKLINSMLEEDASKRATIEMVKASEWFNGPILEEEELKAAMNKFLQE